MSLPAIIYGLCLMASAGCAFLLSRAFQKSRVPLIGWTAVSFCFFALNNFILVLDMLVVPGTDLWVWRQVAAAAGLGVLIVGFVWEMR